MVVVVIIIIIIIIRHRFGFDIDILVHISKKLYGFWPILYKEIYLSIFNWTILINFSICTNLIYLFIFSINYDVIMVQLWFDLGLISKILILPFYSLLSSSGLKITIRWILLRNLLTKKKEKKKEKEKRKDCKIFFFFFWLKKHNIFIVFVSETKKREWGRERREKLYWCSHVGWENKR